MLVHKCSDTNGSRLLPPSPRPMPPLTVGTCSSPPAVQPVPGRSTGLLYLPPCLSGRSAKEAGQRSPCSFQGLAEQPKRRRGGTHTDWRVGDPARAVREGNTPQPWCCIYKPVGATETGSVPTCRHKCVPVRILAANVSSSCLSCWGNPKQFLALQWKHKGILLLQVPGGICFTMVGNNTQPSSNWHLPDVLDSSSHQPVCMPPACKLDDGRWSGVVVQNI